MFSRKQITRTVQFAVIPLSLLLHVYILFFNVSLKDPAELEEIQPAFPMIDAVLVEMPAEIPLTPPIEPEPAPEPEPEVIQEVNEAAVADETADEEVQPEPVETSEPLPKQPEDAVVKQSPVNFIPFYKVEKRPQFINQAKLDYPRQAKKNRIEGTVILEADIDSYGKIVRTKIVKKAGFGFDEAAADMIRNSTFSPAFMDGRAVAVRMRFTLKFEL